MSKPKRTKHNYTTEIELKCLLIRIKNKKLERGFESKQRNNRVNKYVKWFNLINNKKYPQEEIQRKNEVKYRIKAQAIKLSEDIIIDEESYENFGNIILLMISKILTKPNFSGYTYKDEMYSDAIYKILKYLHNFDHTLISERSGLPVNSFAYISQIIHNSVIYIIILKKKELDNIKNQVSLEIINHQLQLQDYNKHTKSQQETDKDYEDSRIRHEIYLDYIPGDLITEINNIDFTDYDIDDDDKIMIYIPENYKISMEEYNELNPLLKTNISLLRMKADLETEDEDDQL